MDSLIFLLEIDLGFVGFAVVMIVLCGICIYGKGFEKLNSDVCRSVETLAFIETAHAALLYHENGIALRCSKNYYFYPTDQESNASDIALVIRESFDSGRLYIFLDGVTYYLRRCTCKEMPKKCRCNTRQKAITVYFLQDQEVVSVAMVIEVSSFDDVDFFGHITRLRNKYLKDKPLDRDKLFVAPVKVI